MASAPALPADIAVGGTVTEAWVDAVRDLQEWFRDTAATLFVGHSQAILTATSTEIAFSDGSGSFNTAPNWNVGSWTAASGGNTGVLVPFDGYYLITANANWQANTSGATRRIIIEKDGATLAGSGVSSTVSPPDSPTPCRHGVQVVASLTDGDELGLEVRQGSGSTLTSVFYLQVKWLADNA